MAGVEGGGEAGLVSVVIEVAGDVVGLFVEHMSYAHRRGDGDEQGAGACVGIQVGIAQVGGRILVFG